MKTLLTFRNILMLAGLFYTTALYSQERTDSDKDGFLGAVESVKLISFEVVTEGDKFTRGAATRGYQVRSYNKNGQRLEVNYYSPDGTVSRNEKYTYNNMGQLLEAVYRTGGQIFKKEVYKYDKTHNLLEKIIYTGDGEIDNKTTYVYNKAGEQIEVSTYRSSFGELALVQKELFTYDGHGNNITITHVDAEGNSFGSQKMLYDDKGNLIEDQNISEDGSMLNKLRYVYNDANELIERHTIGENGNVERNATLNKRGQILSLESYDAEGKITRKSGKTYDDYGNTVAEFRYNQEGAKTIGVAFDFQYDRHHNWTDQKVTQGGQVVSFMGREFVYFE